MDWKNRKAQIIEEERLNNEKLSSNEKLIILSEMRKIELQYDLVMKALAEYNENFNKWENRIDKILENLNKKIISLNNSNDILNENMNETIKSYEKELSKILNNASEKTNEYIRDMKAQKEYINGKYKNLFKRKSMLEKLVYVYIIIIPLLFIYVALK